MEVALGSFYIANVKIVFMYMYLNLDSAIAIYGKYYLWRCSLKVPFRNYDHNSKIWLFCGAGR